MLERTILLLIVFFYLSAPASYAQDRSASGMATETLLHKIEFAPKQEATRVSPEGRRVAYEVISGSKRLLVVDGQKKVEFNYISGDFFLSRVVFSPDSKRVAYYGYADGKRGVFVNGEGDQHYETPVGANVTGIVFSPDSKRVAFKCAAGYGSNYISIDGINGKRYDYVTNPLFSTDGRRVAYIAKKNNRYFPVIDGKEEPQSCDTMSINLSPDNSRIMYMGKRGDKYALIVDGQEGTLCDEIQDAIFSPDGKRVAYMAREGKQWFAVVDGKRGKAYCDYWDSTLVFSPDSRRVAYIAAPTGPWRKETLGETEFLKPEGAATKKKPKWIAVVDGKEEKTFDYGTPLLKNGGWVKPKLSGAFVFSSNAKRTAYTALTGSILKLKFKSGRKVQEIEAGVSKWFVVADRKSQKEYSEIRPISLVFSPDGRHLAYTAQIRDKWCVVVDGKERKLYDKILSFKGRVIFDSEDAFHYVAQGGGNIYLVEEALK